MQADRYREGLTLRAVLLSADRELVARLRETLFGVGGVELLGVATRTSEIPALLAVVAPDLVLADPTSLGSGMEELAAAASEQSDAIWLTLGKQGPAGGPYVVDRPPSIDELRAVLAPLRLPGDRLLPARRPKATGGDAERPGRYLRRLLVRSPGHLRLLPVEDVLWIDAVHNAVKLHSLQGEFRLRQSITALLCGLDPARFMRIHRSTIVQIEAVREFRINARGQYFAVMPGGSILTVSRSYHEALLARLRADGQTAPPSSR